MTIPNWLNLLPFGIFLVEKKKIIYMNDLAKEYLALGKEKDLINIPMVQGRLGFSLSIIEEGEKDIRILDRNLKFYSIKASDDLFIFVIYSKEKEAEDPISYLVHELKNPLSTINGAIQSFLDGLLGETSQEQLKYLNIAKNNVKRIERLIEEIYYFKSLEKATEKLFFSPIDFEVLFKDFIEEFMLSEVDFNIKIKGVENIRKLKIYGDKEKIIQIFFNILNNAIIHLEGKKEIEIEFKIEYPFLQISVSNFGKPIPEEIKDLIFLPFQRGDKKGGLGLGLPIAKKIIEKHNGKIWFQSSEDKTTFFFTLPIFREEKVKVLLVDDERDFLDIIKNYFEREGYEVYTSTNGKEALKVYENVKPRLIVTDLMMEGGHGWEFIKKLREGKANCKIIVISGLTSTFDKSISLDLLKVDAFITKPFSPLELTEKAMQVLND